jgi:hypothetical protein
VPIAHAKIDSTKPGATITLPDGFLLKGSVAPSTVPGTTTGNVNVVGDGFSVPTSDGPYQLALPAGDYPFTYFAEAKFPDGGVVYTVYSETVHVCGDANHDVALPSPPALSTAQVTVDHLDRLDSSSGPLLLFLETSDHIFTFTAPATPAAGATSVTFTIHAPVGAPLTARVGTNPLGAVTLPSAAPLSVPDGIKLVGRVISPDPIEPTQSSVGCFGTIYNTFLPTMTQPSTATYSLTFPYGTTCDVQAGIEIASGQTGPGAPQLGTLLSPVIAVGTATQAPDFAVPAVVNALRPFTVRLVDARGNPVPKASVVASSIATTPTDWIWTPGDQGPVADDGTMTLHGPPATYDVLVAQ